MPIMTDGRTNTQIMQTDQQFLGGIQKQVRFLMSQGLRRNACPNCGALHNLPEAAGVSVDDYDFGQNAKEDRVGPCKGCGRTLIFTLPMIGGDWHWRLDPSEAKR
jgi:hypothetical protein